MFNKQPTDDRVDGEMAHRILDRPGHRHLCKDTERAPTLAGCHSPLRNRVSACRPPVFLQNSPSSAAGWGIFKLKELAKLVASLSSLLFFYKWRRRKTKICI